MKPWFQRPYRIYFGPLDSSFAERKDGWWFMAFGIPWRVRGWRIYRWDKI